MWAALKGARETKTRLTVKFQLTFVEGSSRFCALLSFPREQRERPPQPTKRLRSALDSRNPVPSPTLSHSHGHKVPRAARTRTPAGPRHGPRGPHARRGGGPPGGGGGGVCVPSRFCALRHSAAPVPHSGTPAVNARSVQGSPPPCASATPTQGGEPRTRL